MNITLHIKNTAPCGEIMLPASKSISNRVLILNALSDSPRPVENLADCDDTRAMLSVLHSDQDRFDIGHAGTAMRFLTAFLSRSVGKWEITGSERMQQRPVGVLVEALNRLGARIEYLKNPGYPPLRIYGSHLAGGEIEIPASVSSQYISALMMIAPYMEKGLVLKLQGSAVSTAYIEMTVRLMREFGAQVDWQGTAIRVAPGGYLPRPYRVESDWSAASYFFEWLAIAGSGEIRMQGLTQDSMQGDAAQVKVWERLGVYTSFQPQGVVIKSIPVSLSCLEYDFINMPDLVQSFAVACCMRRIPFVFDGVKTLRIKETDRINALSAELRKLGYLLDTDGENRLLWNGTLCPPSLPEIATYHDHRMAMAFAPAALRQPGLTILQKEVVTKSFPHYWEEIQKLY